MSFSHTEPNLKRAQTTADLKGLGDKDRERSVFQRIKSASVMQKFAPSTEPAKVQFDRQSHESQAPKSPTLQRTPSQISFLEKIREQRLAEEAKIAEKLRKLAKDRAELERLEEEKKRIIAEKAEARRIKKLDKLRYSLNEAIIAISPHNFQEALALLEEVKLLSDEDKKYVLSPDPSIPEEQKTRSTLDYITALNRTIFFHPKVARILSPAFKDALQKIEQDIVAMNGAITRMHPETPSEWSRGAVTGILKCGILTDIERMLVGIEDDAKELRASYLEKQASLEKIFLQANPATSARETILEEIRNLFLEKKKQDELFNGSKIVTNILSCESGDVNVKSCTEHCGFSIIRNKPGYKEEQYNCAIDPLTRELSIKFGDRFMAIPSTSAEHADGTLKITTEHFGTPITLTAQMAYIGIDGHSNTALSIFQDAILRYIESQGGVTNIHEKTQARIIAIEERIIAMGGVASDMFKGFDVMPIFYLPAPPSTPIQATLPELEGLPPTSAEAPSLVITSFLGSSSSDNYPGGIDESSPRVPNVSRTTSRNASFVDMVTPPPGRKR